MNVSTWFCSLAWMEAGVGYRGGALGSCPCLVSRPENFPHWLLSSSKQGWSLVLFAHECKRPTRSHWAEGAHFCWHLGSLFKSIEKLLQGIILLLESTVFQEHTDADDICVCVNAAVAFTDQHFRAWAVGGRTPKVPRCVRDYACVASLPVSPWCWFQWLPPAWSSPAHRPLPSPLCAVE